MGDGQEFRILAHDLTIEDGELTPSLKVKRKVVEDRHRDCSTPCTPRPDRQESTPTHTGSVPSALPEGEDAPRDGALPDASRAGLGERPFGVYVHVPFCATRCGYCDFNTYTATELGGGASQAAYAGHRCRRGPPGPPGSGRRPTSGRPPSSSAAAPRRCCRRTTSRACCAASATSSGCAADAEVTTEANPDSVDAESWPRCGRPGSIGSRSACSARAARPGHAGPHPRPGRVPRPSRGRGRPGSSTSAST